MVDNTASEQQQPHASRNWLLIGVLVLGLVAPVSGYGSADTRNKIKIRKKTRLTASTNDQKPEEYNAERADLLAQKRRNLILDIQRFIRDAHDADQKAELNLRRFPTTFGNRPLMRRIMNSSRDLHQQAKNPSETGWGHEIDFEKNAGGGDGVGASVGDRL